MATATVANVRKATADNDTLAGPHHYERIRVVNGANANNTVIMRKGTSTGEIIWQSKVLAANEVEESRAEIHMGGVDIWVDMSQAGGVLFLYSC